SASLPCHRFAATGQDNLGIARPVPEPAGGRFPAQQISHFPCEFLETVPVQVGSRPGRRQVAGQHTLGVSDQVWNAGNEDGAWSSEPGADEDVLEAVVAHWSFALAGALGRAEILLHQRPDLVVGNGRRS